MAGVAVQQPSEWDPGRRDGPRQDHPDYCTHHIPYGAEESERTLSCDCSSLVSNLIYS